ncbi:MULTISPECIES: NUDIX hydrolase [Catenuloplanes]|uniref:8-oxo-dGTP diphosphatase n=1 Tax=Catenuloplanes niger TaxID=587534 RepID=A0AAE3ZRP2_9ACTN|nr:NUDIX hydrolase [Catenuloplanes niger]MDR7324828.1 8-oxo-dGTP diphosphatase [Catenuloplanes niger]
MAALRTVRAAGGVLWRPAAHGPEICLIHRPKYDDWSLPKGKLDPGEHPLTAAVREVGEETAVPAVPQVRLPAIRYETRDAAKLVEYWSMRPRPDVEAAPFTPNAEVDDLRWLPVPQARKLLSYPHDGRVVDAFAALPPVTAVLAVVRHGHAGRREAWPGADSARPLDEVGALESRELAELCAHLGPQRLISASPRRCQQTLAPLAATVDLPVEVDASFDEPRSGERPEQRHEVAADRIRVLAAAGEPVVVCSQGKIIPDALCRVAGHGTPRDFHSPKGTGWLLAFAGDRLVGSDRLLPSDSRVVQASARS